MTQQGVVAAGHPASAGAGAQVLRSGGNAVDAALAALIASFAAEPLLTGLGAGGYMLVAEPGGAPRVLDFFAQTPTLRLDGRAAQLDAVEVSFGDAVQTFYGGPASCAVPGMAAGVQVAAERWGSMPLEQVAAAGESLAREGVRLNAQQAYVARILEGLLAETAECAEVWAPDGRLLQEGETILCPGLADSIARLASEGSAPFYSGDVGVATADWVGGRGGSLTRDDMAAYRAIERDPVHVGYRGRDFYTNPPPSAGGLLLAYSLARLERGAGHPTLAGIVDAMSAAQSERGEQFMEGLQRPGFADEFLAARLGSTTHISVIDSRGMACSVTSTNGEGSGVVVPGTGIHVNNMMGEQDLNPLGFNRHPAGVRLPSMMAPSVLMRGGEVELVLGSAGSNRIRSALLQVIVGAVDHGLAPQDAVDAPRVHLEEGTLFVEPGIEADELGLPTVLFAAPNLFFGGVQAVGRDGTGRLEGAGDPRRGGAVAVA